MNFLNDFDAQTFFTTYALPWLINIGYAVLIFIIGRFVSKLVVRGVEKSLARTKMDKMASGFIATVLSVALTMMVVILALTQLGLNTATLATVLGAAGLAVGLAMKDSLGNFAAGLMLVLFKPFKIGDYVEVAGQAGSVDDITMFATILRTPDNRIVTVPNSGVFGATVTNYSKEKTRRIDLVVGIDYDSDIKKTKQVLESILDSNDKILKDPAYTVAVLELGDSSVNLVVRPWVATSDYWPVRFELTEQIKLKLDENNIDIPYPHMSLVQKASS